MRDSWYETLKEDFVRGFPAFCGIQVERVGHGEFDTRLDVRPEHAQQDGFVHAGVMATMADHTAGYAAFTLVSEHQRVLTIEFKINYFRPATGSALLCRGRVLHRGRRIIVSDAELLSVDGNTSKRVAKATVTLMVIGNGGGE
jgi:uncharacterized protein (TIGR00369 family)